MLENHEGQTVPETTLHSLEKGVLKTWSTKELFAGKKVILFSLPGAFTPTCTSAHVPRFQELAPVFKKLGVDAILCVSVNDAFVMDVWQKDVGAQDIQFLADGNTSFTAQMGLLVDKQALGFGKRSWRYSMFVNDGKIEKMFIEAEVDGDPYQVSDADTMLKYLDPNASLADDIVLFTKQGCGHCRRAKALLAERGLSYEDVPTTPRLLRAISEKHTTPQVYINGKYIGGADELTAYYAGK
jgi:glutathione-dependent peroxiredoxin